MSDRTGACCGDLYEEHELRLGEMQHPETGEWIEAMLVVCTVCDRCPGWEDFPSFAHVGGATGRIAELRSFGVAPPEDWRDRFGWRMELGWIQARTGGRAGDPSPQALWTGGHVVGSVHKRESDDPEPNEANGGTDGCGTDIGRGCTYDDLVACWEVIHEPEVAAVTDQAIFEHTYFSYGDETYYAPHDHCSHGNNVHVHWGIVPGGQLPPLDPQPEDPPADRYGARGRTMAVRQGGA